MGERRRYRRRQQTLVTAVQFALESDGFTYQKWGHTQSCKRGDWLVDSGGDIYTIDADVFERTYTAVSPGRFLKTAIVWAEQAAADGTIQTKEGHTDYRAGDFLVYNDARGSDGYAVSRSKFAELYEPLRTEKLSE